MTSEAEFRAVVVDTNVLSYITRQSQRNCIGQRYSDLLLGGGWQIALSFAALTELRGAEWTERKRGQLEDLITGSLNLPHGEATSTWFNRAASVRRRLGLDDVVDDNDLWVISGAAEYNLPYMSADAGALRVAYGLSLEVLTLHQFADGILDADQDHLR